LKEGKNQECQNFYFEIAHFQPRSFSSCGNKESTLFNFVGKWKYDKGWVDIPCSGIFPVSNILVTKTVPFSGKGVCYFDGKEEKRREE
jgi:hypothetical protein